MKISELGYDRFKDHSLLAPDIPSFLAEIFSKLPRILQFEVLRFIAPQGPLTFNDIDHDLLDKYLPSAPSLRPDIIDLCDSDDEDAAERASTGSEPPLDLDAFTLPNPPCRPPAALLPEQTDVHFADLYYDLCRLCTKKGYKFNGQPASDSFWNSCQDLVASPDALPPWTTIALRATIHREGGQIGFKLESPILGESRRYYRIYGWHRWIRAKITQTHEHDVQRGGPEKQRLDAFLKAPLILDKWLGGYRFRAVLHKEGSILFFAESGPGLVDIYDFAEQQIPTRLNPDMTLAKYRSRFQLGLAKTAPSITFPIKLIRRVPDVRSSTLLVGFEAMKGIARELGVRWVPSCISATAQTRLGTADVTWMVMPQFQGLQVTADMLSSEATTFEARFRMLDAQRERSKVVRFRVNDPCCPILKLGRQWEGAGLIMTDGCAQISHTAALAIRESLKLKELPSAYQARLGSSKGLWLLNTAREFEDGMSWIEVCDSQYKYNSAPGFEHVFEIIRFTQQVSFGQLNYQVIRVLAHQGVPKDEFVHLLKLATKDNVQDLLEWDPENKAILRKAIESCADVSSRPARIERPGATFAPNARYYGKGEYEDFDIGNDSKWQDSSDCVGPCIPRSRAQQAIEMLDAGSSLRDNPYLHDRLRSLYEIQVDRARTMHIPLAKSATLYVAVDPIGCLGPNEIFVQFSKPWVDPVTNEKVIQLIGDVLVTRDPCVLPTDIQKVTSVFKQELRGYYDVVLFPRCGAVPLCHILSGGDYDGDMVHIIWEPQLVRPFVNAPYMPDTSNACDEYYDSDTSLVCDVFGTVDALQPEGKADFYASVLLGTVNIGQAFGIDHPESILIAQLYAVALDAAKAGKVIKPNMLERLLKLSGSEMPIWWGAVRDEDGDFRANSKPELCDVDVATIACPIEYILLSVHGIQKSVKADFEESSKACTKLFEPDLDLIFPWRDLQRRAEANRINRDPARKVQLDVARAKNDVTIILSHVKLHTKSYRDAAQAFSMASEGNYSSASRLFKQAINNLQTSFYAPLSDLQCPDLRGRASLVWEIQGNAAGWVLAAPWQLAFRHLNRLKATRYELRRIVGRKHSELEGLEPRRIIDESYETLGAKVPKRARLA